jgi:hypothetical protein
MIATSTNMSMRFLHEFLIETNSPGPRRRGAVGGQCGMTERCSSAGCVSSIDKDAVVISFSLCNSPLWAHWPCRLLLSCRLWKFVVRAHTDTLEKRWGEWYTLGRNLYSTYALPQVLNRHRKVEPNSDDFDCSLVYN